MPPQENTGMARPVRPNRRYFIGANIACCTRCSQTIRAKNAKLPERLLHDRQKPSIQDHMKAYPRRKSHALPFVIPSFRHVSALESRIIDPSTLSRMRQGNPGDGKSVGEGVSELRVDYGPGYRVISARKGGRWSCALR